jgi:hypothetical protein
VPDAPIELEPIDPEWALPLEPLLLPVEPAVPVLPVLDPVLPVLDPVLPIPDADDPDEPPIEAFARMKSLPREDDDEEPELVEPADDALEPLPDCRQPVKVTFWLPPFLLLDCPELMPDEDPVEPDVEPDVDPGVCPAVDPPCEPDAPPDWAETPTARTADNIVPKIN